MSLEFSIKPWYKSIRGTTHSPPGCVSPPVPNNTSSAESFCVYITGEKYVSFSSGVLTHLSTSPVLPENIKRRPTRRWGLFGSLIKTKKKSRKMMCKFVKEIIFHIMEVPVFILQTCFKHCTSYIAYCDISSLHIFVLFCFMFVQHLSIIRFSRLIKA